MLTVFFRTLIIYLVLLTSMRLMGKRQIGELQLSELVTAFMLSELAVIPISDKHVPLAYAILPILLLLSLEVILSFLLTKCAPLKTLFLGKPSLLIRDGVIDQNELGRLRITLDEFLGELRQKDIADPETVSYAILEANGKLSVFEKAADSPATRQDLKVPAPEAGVAHAVIIDGKPCPVGITVSGHDDGWLRDQLAGRRLREAEVFLMTVDDLGTVRVIAKEKCE